MAETETRVDPRTECMEFGRARVYKLKGKDGGRKTKKELSEKPAELSELDKVILQMKEECEEAEKKRLEKEAAEREEDIKNTIEKIVKASAAGKPERAKKILEEFAEKEGTRIALEMNRDCHFMRPVRHMGRPSQTIFFRTG